MQRAIRINEHLSVIPVFLKEEVLQLTSAGTQYVERVTCMVYNADGLRLLGEGIALRQPEDEANDHIGRRLALSRALKDAMMGLPERGQVFQAFVQALRGDGPTAPQYFPPARILPFPKAV